MTLILPALLLVFSLLCGSHALSQALPPTALTAPAPASTAPLATQGVPSRNHTGRAVHRAAITYSGGRLGVVADNSSLNQILHEISQITGMKITGGVVDESVFGSYGPADPSIVLSALLDGTGSNMLLTLNSARMPAELVLTPRQGGATPPSPNLGSYSNREDDLPPARRYGPPPSAGLPMSAYAPAQSPPSPALTPAAVQPANTPAGIDATAQEPPEGARTPQQIYDQLMKMQQQAKQPGQAPPE